MLVFFRSFFSSLVLELRGLSGTSDTDRRGRILDLRAGLGEDSVRWSLRPSLSCGSDGYVTKVALFIDAGDPALRLRCPLSRGQTPKQGERKTKYTITRDGFGDRICRQAGDSCVLHAPPKVECSIVDFLLSDMPHAAISPLAFFRKIWDSTKSPNKKSVIKLKVN